MPTAVDTHRPGFWTPSLPSLGPVFRLDASPNLTSSTLPGLRYPGAGHGPWPGRVNPVGIAHTGRWGSQPDHPLRHFHGGRQARC